MRYELTDHEWTAIRPMLPSKPRGCPVGERPPWIRLTVAARPISSTSTEKKTGRPVKFELTDQTRQAADDYLKAASKTVDDIAQLEVVPPLELDAGISLDSVATREAAG